MVLVRVSEARKVVNGTSESYLGHSRAIYTRGVEIYSRYGKEDKKIYRRDYPKLNQGV